MEYLKAVLSFRVNSREEKEAEGVTRMDEIKVKISNPRAGVLFSWFKRDGLF